ncbi:MAG: NAD(P)/FAD-dependent oxidoreductase [Chloroflexi bacterium]|nr:NAD(P)/FAD-dependent oxidoreductase [Chloroflexota bacterium]
MYDALIIGGGPTGSYIASRLASWGHRVLVIEQQSSIGKATCCTGIVSKECLDAFQVGRPAIVRESRSARFFAPSGEHLRLEKETTQAYIVERTAFDNQIARDAQVEGAEYLMDSKAISVATGRDFATVRVKSQGRLTDVEGKTLVIASGFGSKLPQTLGLGKISDFVMGAQAEVETKEIDEVEVYFGSRIAPGFFAWLVPTSRGRALAGLLTRRRTASYMKAFLDYLASQGKVISPAVDIRYGGIPLKPLPKTSRERVVVIGDAAGQVKPTTGGGICYGLLCADMAADTLHRALNSGDFRARALSSYDRKWKEALSTELRLGRWARWLYEKLNDRQVDYLFRRARSKRIPEALLNSDDFSFDSHGRLILRGARLFGVIGVISLLWLFLNRK